MFKRLIKNSEYAASLVEATIVIPAFLVLVLSSISAVQILYGHMVISEGLREAGRAAATRTSGCTAAALATFTNHLNRFGIESRTYLNPATNLPRPVLEISYPTVSDPAVGVSTRWISLNSNVRIDCTMCRTLERMGIIFPLGAERTFQTPLETQDLEANNC